MLPSYHPKRFEHIMADVVFGRWAGQLRHLMRCSCVKTCGCARLFVRALSRKTIDTSRALACHPDPRVWYRVCIFRDVFPFFGWRWFCEPVCAYSHAAHRVSESESPVGPAECAHLTESRLSGRQPRAASGRRRSGGTGAGRRGGPPQRPLSA